VTTPLRRGNHARPTAASSPSRRLEQARRVPFRAQHPRRAVISGDGAGHFVSRAHIEYRPQRTLAGTGARDPSRRPYVPDVPTFAEVGFPPSRCRPGSAVPPKATPRRSSTSSTSIPPRCRPPEARSGQTTFIDPLALTQGDCRPGEGQALSTSDRREQGSSSITVHAGARGTQPKVFNRSQQETPIIYKR